jgi:hypothetical protein
MQRTVRLVEISIGLLTLLAGGACAAMGLHAGYDTTLPGLCKWLGVVLLAQGLLRDAALLLARDVGCDCARVTEPSLCLESLVGIMALAQAALLWCAHVVQPVVITVPLLLSGFGLWWLMGMVLHDTVVIVRRSRAPSAAVPAAPRAEQP